MTETEKRMWDQASELQTLCDETMAACETASSMISDMYSTSYVRNRWGGDMVSALALEGEEWFESWLYVTSAEDRYNRILEDAAERASDMADDEGEAHELIIDYVNEAMADIEEKEWSLTVRAINAMFDIAEAGIPKLERELKTLNKCREAALPFVGKRG